MPSTQLLDALPILLVFVAFAIVTLICYEVGFRLGRWWQERTPGEQEGPTGMLVGSILALLAFLLAVTMGMASGPIRRPARARPGRGERDRDGVPPSRLPAGTSLEPGPGAAPPVRAAADRRPGYDRHPGRGRSIERDPREAVDGDRGRGQDERLRRRGALRRLRSTRRSISTRAGSRRASMRASRRRSCSCSSVVPR